MSHEKKSRTSERKKRERVESEPVNNQEEIYGTSISASTALTLFSPPSSLKKPKIVTPKIGKTKDYIEMFDPDQNELYEYLTETLTEMFFEAVLIAKGKITLADSQNRAKDIINVIAIAGGQLLPFVGGAVSGISLLTYMVRYGLKERQEAIQRERVGRINTFISGGHKRIWKISSEVAVLICIVYAEQIKKLSTHGKQQFVSFIVGIMFDHILNGCPRPQSFFKKLGADAANLFKWMLWKVMPSLLGPEPDPEFIHPAVSMLEGLIFFVPEPGKRNRINVKEEFASKMAFYVEGILQSNIQTPFGEFYTHEAASSVYGYRQLPQIYAEGLGYKREQSTLQAPVTQKHHFKPIEFKKFCSYRDSKSFTGKFDSELADKVLAINGLRRGKATKKGNNCLLDTFFILINEFFDKNFPELVLEDFRDFVNFVRERIGRNDGGMLSVNDEEEGIRILLSIQEYLRLNCNGFLANFDLEVYVPDREGDLAIVDNISQIQNQVNRNSGVQIPIRVIQTNFDHYEPVFTESPSLEVMDLTPRRLEMK